jgi:Protein of unknown function (DUF3237)
MTYRLTAMRGPLGATDGSPNGTRRYFEMTSGVLQGEGINATMALPGGDWMRVSHDGFWRPDVRIQWVTDDGAVVLMHYTGLVEQTPAFMSAADADQETSFDDQYMRVVITFDTGARRYRWLNQSIFVARGRLLGASQIEYEVHRIT